MGHKNKRILTAFLSAMLVGILTLGLAACNSDDDSESKSSNNESSSMSSSGESDGVTVGGAKMVKDKDIVDNAVNAENVTTVVSLVKLAELVDTLKSDGPFTVFAPNNGAFEKLPAETAASLQEEENRETLKGILTYHVVSGTYTSADLKVMAQNGETLTTVQGGKLTPVIKDGKVVLEDTQGNQVEIETTDVISSNGVTHVIKSVLMPS